MNITGEAASPAVHALREVGVGTVPGIGDKRQPLWPDGPVGSISHCASTALANHIRLGVSALI
ncbi:hypothetical protein KCP75_01860 [Salmonella enterica subsp. enterica]|nr:hypothetical protein KCP75_01860 [Salmonella enterica subsp. enterica]